MGMSIHIFAERECVVTKTGKKFTNQAVYGAWQTPTEATSKILASDDKIQAYKDWVLGTCQDHNEPVYAEDDIFCIGEPVGTERYNAGVEHVKDFEEWLEFTDKEGYDVFFKEI